MKFVSLVYATHDGQTEKIIQQMRSRLEAQGHEVEVMRISKNSSFPSLDPRSEIVVIGAPVRAGRFPQSLLSWTRRQTEALALRDKALFTVSLNAADKRPEARLVDRALLKEFTKQTGFSPRIAASLIGALKYRSYNVFTRFILKRISARAGGPTDTSRDHELTDWNAANNFLEDVISNPPRRASSATEEANGPSKVLGRPRPSQRWFQRSTD